MNLREHSKSNFGSVGERATCEEINVGSLQRIADACELMAKNYKSLVEERDRFQQYFWDETKLRKVCERRLSALRGVITKLKKK